jgi:isoquinoline 1-oxidoreductase alpha subunit
MAKYQLNVNGERREVSVDGSTPLLWVLREDLNMTGTKYGCGVSACGACTVHVGGVATRSCMLPVALLGERPVVTIEAMAPTPSAASCRTNGSSATWCSAATARAGRSCARSRSSSTRPKPTDTNIDESMGGNICRCGTYVRIREPSRPPRKSLK